MKTGPWWQQFKDTVSTHQHEHNMRDQKQQAMRNYMSILIQLDKKIRNLRFSQL
jgi:hypothetical protein